MANHATEPRKQDGVFWIAVLLWGAIVAWLSVARYLAYNTSMLDLGNMSQAIGSVLRGQPLVYTSEYGPTSRLAIHVELIYFFIAPVYALWSDPRLLLIIQAALYVSGAIPAYQLAFRRTKSRFAARCAALITLLYPVALTSVLFDFHGDTLAMPLLLWALNALDARRWWRYGVMLALALCCKFYVAVVVFLLGIVIWRTRGDRLSSVGF